MTYVKRLLELVVITFLGAAVPAVVAGGLNKAAFAGAWAIGVAAVYGLVAKKVGDPEKPTVAK